MQVPILSGIYSDNGPDLRTSYPVNYIPVPKDSGVSNGFLRPAYGLVKNGTGLGPPRGAINWNGTVYRVLGTKLCTVAQNGVVIVLGDVGGPINTLVTFDYSFDRLAIASGGRLYYWNVALTQVTDPDLGIVLDVVWIDGYFMTTDGASLVVTELNDPYAVNPLKYGASEADPDPVIALLKLRNEVYALNRYTIEVFDNVGGNLFPFQRIEGAQIQKGLIGTFGCCVFVESIAFLGSGKNEAPGIYLGSNATATKISTQEIDQILTNYTELQLAQVKLEAQNDKAHKHLYIHLPDRTLVYDAAASEAVQKPVWFTLTSSIVGFSEYKARDLVWCFDRWNVADPTSNNLGYMVDNIGDHYGEKVRWEFGTQIVYNESHGAIFNSLELVSLTGRVMSGNTPQISTAYSVDGESWSQEFFISVGSIGDRTKRLVWFQQGFMRNMRIQRFKGDSDAHISFIRLEAALEPLAF